MLPYYVAVAVAVAVAAVAAVYGGLTWATNSILPALVLHVVGDVVVLTRCWLVDLPEWQLTADTPPLVWQSGIDAPFAIAAALLVLFTTLCGLGYRQLRRGGLAVGSGSERAPSGG